MEYRYPQKHSADPLMFNNTELKIQLESGNAVNPGVLKSWYSFLENGQVPRTDIHGRIFPPVHLISHAEYEQKSTQEKLEIFEEFILSQMKKTRQ